MIWDYIVVGAGSSGCAVANRLSASGNRRVLVLEAGRSNQSMLFRVPSAPGIFGYTKYDWGFHSAPDPTRNGKSELWPRGQVVGGSSSINGMNYVRGAACDFDRWAALGNTGWSASEVLPLFRDIERCDESIRQADKTGIRGYDGALHVKTVSGRHAVTQAFMDAAQAAGHPFNPDYNGATQEGIGYTQASQRRGRRWSAADAFLEPALTRKNLTLKTNALVHRVLFQNGRACGIRYEEQGVISEVQAKHIILSGGAINTPQLLMLSGVGDGKALQALGIEVVVDRPAVGKNLAEHPILMFTYRVNVPTYNLTGGLAQKAGFLARYLLKGEGPLSMFIESIGFLKTTPSESEPDVQLHVGPFGWSAEVAKEGLYKEGPSLSTSAKFPCLTIILNKNRPVSRGQLRLASADPRAKPLIEPQLLQRPEDVETFVRSVPLIRGIMARQPVAGYVIEEIYPGKAVTTEESVLDFIKQRTDIAAHPVGTCRMGIDDDAVVTPQLQVKGVEGLWIADASIMPDLISGNTNAVCMMIGEKLGRMLASTSQ